MEVAEVGDLLRNRFVATPSLFGSRGKVVRALAFEILQISSPGPKMRQVGGQRSNRRAAFFLVPKRAPSRVPFFFGKSQLFSQKRLAHECLLQGFRVCRDTSLMSCGGSENGRVVHVLKSKNVRTKNSRVHVVHVKNVFERRPGVCFKNSARSSLTNASFLSKPFLMGEVAM